MKSKFLTTIAIAAVAGLVSSCDMDLAPEGMLDQTKAIQSVNDARSFRNNFYTATRAISSSQFYTAAEIQADCFNGLTINGNRLGTLANGTVDSSDGDILTYWAALYSYINNCNYFLSVVEPLYAQAVADNNHDDAVDYARFIAEAHFFRGYFYAIMFDRWCVKYDPAKADEQLGLPIVTEYNPTADRSKYKGRGTARQLVEFINSEIKLGYDGLKEYEEIDPSNLTPMAPYISSLAIAAMQARMALWTSDYDTAISKADEVISSNVYTLSGTDSKVAATYFKNMWTKDDNREIIFMPFESTQELGNAIGTAWIGTMSDQADYIPTSEAINELSTGYNAILASRGDIRIHTYVEARTLTAPLGNYKTPCFVKFPGNPQLQTSGPNIVNKPKTFRLAELYLIKAEAAFNKGDQTTANSTLKTLWEHRISGVEYTETEGGALMDEIIHQRTCELMGEGFRLSDLRRWNLGFTRSDDYSSTKFANIDKSKIPDIITPAGLEVEYTRDDYRYTWPIPSKEMDVNPQLKGQQNPGYGN